MTIRFSIHFIPQEGEKLFIACSDSQKELALEQNKEHVWSREISINPLKNSTISYKYSVHKQNGQVYYEAGKPRSIAIDAKTLAVDCCDQWCGNNNDAPFLTAPFTDVYFTEDNAKPYSCTHKSDHELILRSIIPNIPKDCEVRISGSHPALGEWNPQKSVVMMCTEGQRKEISINTERFAGEEWEYKFVLFNKKENRYIWEEGENRKICIPSINSNSTMIAEQPSPHFGISAPRFAGCAVPVFSLRSKSSHGTGDFKDIRLLADWAKAVGLSVIQLLPINDTTAHLSWMDSYPYNCISTLALHPLYINLEELGELDDLDLKAELKQEQQTLNSLKFLDYTQTWNSKMRYCRAMYRQDKESVLKSDDCRKFIEDNNEWLMPYAVFCTLRDHFGTADFKTWGTVGKMQTSEFSKELIEELCSDSSLFADDIYFYVYLQYNLNRQMCATKEYAHKCGVAIKGDIPIGIARYSVEAWQYPHLFNFSQSAGAPPDFFSKTGQNWGFPTYNWDKMAEDGYAWWKQRLSLFSKYFDAYRIDHILGFFRIWETPVEYSDGRLGHLSPALPFTPQQIQEMGVPFTTPEEMCGGIVENGTVQPTYNGLFIEDPYNKGHYHPMISAKDGSMYQSLEWWQKEAFNHLYDYYFFQRHNELWYCNAMRKLQQLIAATNMLACGEDLGMLSESVTRCMENLKILSLELMIMPKQFGAGLGNPATYPYLSVCTTSTHDSETMRMWLGKHSGTDDASPERCIEILKQNLAAPSMLAIFPLQDWISIDSNIRNVHVNDERINDPSNPHHYWRYRVHLNIEELIDAAQMNTTISAIVRESGRGN